MSEIDVVKWKLFSYYDLDNAEHFALKGGISIHLSGKASVWFNKNTPAHVKRVFGDKEFAHMFGPDREILTREAVSIGCKANWIQFPDNPKKMHFDITGSILTKAIEKCKNKSKYNLLK